MVKREEFEVDLGVNTTSESKSCREREKEEGEKSSARLNRNAIWTKVPPNFHLLPFLLPLQAAWSVRSIHREEPRKYSY